MRKFTTKQIIIVLIILSVIIYGIQLLIYRDPSTTGFYILQDLAFMPITIAIATIAVGEVISAREKKERLQKTQMLTSSFFTELGVFLMMDLMKESDCDERIRRIVSDRDVSEQSGIEELQAEISNLKVRVRMSEPFYTRVRQMILEKQTILLVISSNPMLLEHESFTDMLWGIFHLIDEFRLRGEYADLKPADIHHFEEDFGKVLKLLLMNWVPNVKYLKQTYPNFYGAARDRMELVHGSQKE